MDEEMRGSFASVEKNIRECIVDEKLRAVALMINDMAAGTVELTMAGMCDPMIAEHALGHSNAMISVIVGIDHGIDIEDLRASNRIALSEALNMFSGN